MKFRNLAYINDLAADQAEDILIQDLVAQQCSIHPEKPAIVLDNKSLTYAELDKASNRLAHYLIRQGIVRESIIGFAFPRSLEMIIGILGVLKAGAAYIAIDPETPQDRIDYILSDSRPALILTTSAHQHKFSNYKSKIIYDLSLDEINRQSIHCPDIEIASDNLAYVIYTSGSTGYPKGVMIEHRSVVNLILSMQKVPGLSSSDVMLSINSIAFDVAAMEIFLPLSVGAQILMVERDKIANAWKLKEAIDNSVTFVQTTASTWRMLLEAGWKGNKDIRIISTGEPLEINLAKLLLQNCRELWNFYGPTETTVYSSACRIFTDDSGISIGYPVDNTALYILDDKLNAMNPGESGELHIGGAGLARGYLNKKDLTDKKFIHDPFVSNSKARMYKTGDQVTMLPDGKISYIGRKDFQIKINGHRIELGEIEQTLLKYPGIHQAIVTSVDSPTGHIQLAAYLVFPANHSGSIGNSSFQSDIGKRKLIKEMQVFCRKKLPSYMVPSYFVLLEKIPLNQSGKIDRNALPEPDSFHVPVNILREIIPPESECEKLLVKIWQDLLHVEEISIIDNFFDLGGDSLLGVRMVNAANIAGLEFSINHFFMHQSIKELADSLESSSLKKDFSYIIPINESGSGYPVFFFPAGGGNFKEYKTISSYLGNENPAYYFLPNGAYKTRDPFISIETLALEYLNDIIKLDCKGPVCLVGFSLGGAIAYEMAKILKSKEYEIKSLAIIDTYIPGSHYPNSLKKNRERFLFRLQDKLKSVSYRVWINENNTAMRDKVNKEPGNIFKPVKLFLKLLGSYTPPKLHKQELDFRKANNIAFHGYKFEKYEGNVDVIWSRGNKYFDKNKRKTGSGWEKIIRGKFRSHVVDGNHKSILMEPAIRNVAGIIKEAMTSI